MSKLYVARHGKWLSIFEAKNELDAISKIEEHFNGMAIISLHEACEQTKREWMSRKNIINPHIGI